MTTQDTTGRSASDGGRQGGATLRFASLVTLALLPWAYLGLDALFFGIADRMNGFGYLPFFGLLAASHLALKTREERSEIARRELPPSAVVLAVAAAALITVAVVVGVRWVGSWWWAISIAALGLIMWDLHRAYRKVYASAPGNGR